MQTDNKFRTKVYSTLSAYAKYPYKKRSKQEEKRNSRPTRYYIKNKDNTDTPMSLTYYEYKNIIKEYSNVMYEYLFDGHEVELPCGFGSLYIGKFKPKKPKSIKAVDWHKTKQQSKNSGELVYVYKDTSHTDGYVVLLKWNYIHKRVRHKKLFKVSLPKAKKQELAKILKDDVYAINKFSLSNYGFKKRQ